MDVSADTVISIQDQYLDKEDKTQFIDLYRVKLFSLKLRELLLLQSLFGAHGEEDVLQLIQYQPSPRLFYESFFELEMKSCVTLLITYQKAMDYLLSENNSQFFNIMYPIFFKKQDGKSAIDIAL